jgi:hypothetical protein
MESIDIVNLIEKNPITRMNNKNYQNKLIQKLKNEFTKEEQKLFLSSFYCFLNYKEDAFVVDFDNIWKWCGFTRKDNAKRLLEKNFEKDIDYIVFINEELSGPPKRGADISSHENEEISDESCVVDISCEDCVNMELTDEYKRLINLEKKVLIKICKNNKLIISGTKVDIVKRIMKNDNSKNLGGAGQNKESIMLTITTFKKYCIKANTKKADEVHNYYIKLEKILQEIIIEQSDELTLQLSLKNNKIKELEETVYSEQCINIKHQKSLLYQQEKVTNRYKVSRTGCIYIVHDPLWKFTRFKIGKTDDFNERISTYRTSSINMKVDLILYTPHYELFEKVIKVKFCEYAEQPSHEMYIAELNILIDGIKDINKYCAFNGYEENELWKLNVEQPPLPENFKDTTKINKEIIINNYIMPIAMKDDGNKKYIDIENPEPSDLQHLNLTSDIEKYYEISPSSFLPTRILFSEYTMKNKYAPEGMRYCNSFCQDYCSFENFKYKSQYLFTSCNNCRIMEDLARYKIQNNIYTCEQIANNPSLVFLDTNQKLCPYCNIIKHDSKFRKNRKQCNQCKDTKRVNKIKNIRENIDEDLEQIKNLIKDTKNRDELIKNLEKFTRDLLYSICLKLNIKRRSNDNKISMIEKLINHLRTLNF